MPIVLIRARGLLVGVALWVGAAHLIVVADASPKRAERKAPPAAKRGQLPPAAIHAPSAAKRGQLPPPAASQPPPHARKPKPSEPRRASSGYPIATAERALLLTDWTPAPLPNEAIEVIGVAPYPARAESRAHARLQARQAAILDAQQQLVEQLHGVQISATRRKSNLRVDEDITAHAEGILRGAQIVEERDLGDVYEVRMRWTPPRDATREPVPVPSVALPAEQKPLPAPSVSTPPPAAQGYTGVIIDARGLGLQPSMSPRLRDPYGNTLWGNLEIAPETVIEYGLAGWARTEAELQHASLRARIGENPLWLRAIGVQGAGRNEVILDAADAERLLRENATSGLLDRLAVVFLY